MPGQKKFENPPPLPVLLTEMFTLGFSSVYLEATASAIGNTVLLPAIFTCLFSLPNTREHPVNPETPATPAPARNPRREISDRRRDVSSDIGGNSGYD
jgi:hypothetical protein